MLLVQTFTSSLWCHVVRSGQEVGLCVGVAVGAQSSTKGHCMDPKTPSQHSFSES